MTNAEKLAKLREELEELLQTRKTIRVTGQSWKLRNGEDTREVVNVSLAEINREIAETERKIEQLEKLLSGKAVGGIRVKGAVL